MLPFSLKIAGDYMISHRRMASQSLSALSSMRYPIMTIHTKFLTP